MARIPVNVLEKSPVLVVFFLAMVILLATVHHVVAAEGFRSKPIRIVCPAPPGGGVDFACRTIGDPLANRAGQPVVVDNRPGASGAIGAQIVASALPDGNTLLLASSSTIAANPAIQRQSYQTAMKDFSPVSMVSRPTVSLSPRGVSVLPDPIRSTLRRIARMRATNSRVLKGFTT